jgi:hypothetical protein
MNAMHSFVALGLLVGLQAVAADQQSTNLTASVDTSKSQIQPSYPAVQYKLDDPQDEKKLTVERAKIMRIEGLSSQPWILMATRRSDSTLFHDAREQEPKLYLCSLGHEPW